MDYYPAEADNVDHEHDPKLRVVEWHLQVAVLLIMQTAHKPILRISVFLLCNRKTVCVFVCMLVWSGSFLFPKIFLFSYALPSHSCLPLNIRLHVIHTQNGMTCLDM